MLIETKSFFTFRRLHTDYFANVVLLTYKMRLEKIYQKLYIDQEFYSLKIVEGYAEKH